MNPSEDTFYSRIPSLSDTELLDYVHNYSSYKEDAVRLAIQELNTRGHSLTDTELNAIEVYFRSKAGPDAELFNFDTSSFRLISYIVLAGGLFASGLIYFTVAPPAPNPLGYDPMDTKQHVRDLEYLGGTINVLATEFTQWFSGLWQGRSLAIVIAVMSVVLAAILWLIGSYKSSELDSGEHSGRS